MLTYSITSPVVTMATATCGVLDKLAGTSTGFGTEVTSKYGLKHTQMHEYANGEILLFHSYHMLPDSSSSVCGLLRFGRLLYEPQG